MIHHAYMYLLEWGGTREKPSSPVSKSRTKGFWDCPGEREMPVTNAIVIENFSDADGVGEFVFEKR